jgi:hypothetical protein
VLTTWGALAAVPSAIALALLAARRPSRSFVALAGAATAAALPLAVGAVVLEVAPHVYEVPGHLCPFCLLKADAAFIGYPLFGALFLAATWGLGSLAAALVARDQKTRDAFTAFGRTRMLYEAMAWTTVLALGTAPVIAYRIASGGASLFR